jgi:putative ABC transport system permease protein
VLLYGGLFVARSFIQAHLGLWIEIGLPSVREWLLLAIVLVAGVVAGLWPALRAYRYSLIDGMTVHV